MGKPKSKTEVTPKGIFVYPCLNKPDTKFDEAGLYTVKLKLSVDEAQPLMDMIGKAMDAQVEKVKASGEVKGKVKRADPPYVEDEESGTVTFNFKMKASGKRKDGTTFTQKPTLKKHDLTDVDPDVRIWGGSEGKVAFEMVPFYTGGLGAGVSLRLKGVQVLKLVTGGGDCGFTAEEGEDFDSDNSGDSSEFSPEESDTEDTDSDTEDTDSDAEPTEEDAGGADF